METLDELIARTLAQKLPPEIADLADRARSRHDDVEAVIAYGSCLRGVPTTDSLVDLYVLTRDLKGVSRNAMSRLGCALAPPNVYYIETEFEGRRIRAKYAVLPLALFAAWMRAGNPYFWARFSQPSALAYCVDDNARTCVIAAMAQASRTMFASAKALSPSPDPLAVWTAGFEATYATELRSEPPGRAATLVAANAGYYRETAALLVDVAPLRANWPLRRLAGKLWSMARLAKAAFTFVGGADYIAWKIERHSGEKIALTNWQRRHPVITGLMLLPQLIKRGAVR